MDTNLDIITVFNPDTQPFKIQYDNKSYGVINPGQYKRMPRFLAKLAVKHLVDQCLNNSGKPTNNQELRDVWAQKIVTHEEQNVMPTVESAEDKLKRELEELNKNSDLDRVLNSVKGVDTSPSPVNPPPTQAMPQNPMTETPSVSIPSILPVPPAQPVTDAIGITPPAGADKVLSEVDNTDGESQTQSPPAPAPEKAHNGVTRDQLYEYAEKTLGMTLSDQKTKAALDDQDLPQLIETLGYSTGL